MKDKDKNNSMKSADQPEGFYYSKEDYAGLLKRIIILGIDFVVIQALAMMTIIPMLGLGIDSDIATLIYLLIYFSISYIYLTVMKRTWGTVGYWVSGVQIVDLEGEEPSMWLMTLRYLLFFLGPINVIIDIFWISSDENKQTLRDKIAETYVIRRNAMPLGYGQQKIIPYFIMGYSFCFKEVMRPAAQ